MVAGCAANPSDLEQTMSDRAYTRFSIPFALLSDPARISAVGRIFDYSTEDLAVILAEPVEQEPWAGFDDCSLRLVNGCPCLVWEDADCNYGGADYEDDLIAAGIPYLLAHGAGDEYGAGCTVFDGTTSESTGADSSLHAVVGIVWKDGRGVVDPQEVAEFERFAQLRATVLAVPALAA